MKAGDVRKKDWEVRRLNLVLRTKKREVAEDEILELKRRPSHLYRRSAAGHLSSRIGEVVTISKGAVLDHGNTHNIELLSSGRTP